MVKGRESMGGAKRGRADVYGIFAWFAFVAACLTVYFVEPELLDPRQLRGLFDGHIGVGLLVYFIVATLRGFTLIPLTPILLAGVLVFPPFELLLVNQVAVGTSSAIVYGMARGLKSDQLFRAHYPRQIERLTGLLQRRELPIIAVWGAAPFLPSDLIVYVCGVLRISLWKTLFGICAGEGAICALYIYGGAFGLEALAELVG